jgi:hypothetical protein
MKILILTLKMKEQHDTYRNELSGLFVGQASTSRGTHHDQKKYLGRPYIYKSFFKMPKKKEALYINYYAHDWVEKFLQSLVIKPSMCDK